MSGIGSNYTFTCGQFVRGNLIITSWLDVLTWLNTAGSSCGKDTTLIFIQKQLLLVINTTKDHEREKLNVRFT